MKIKPIRTTSPKAAFTFVEMLVAMSLVAMFIGTAALVMAAIGANAREYANIWEVDIGTNAMTNFYEEEGSTIKTPVAPNFGRLGYVQEIRDKLRDDIASSESVFCLARSGLNTIRPEWIDWPYAADPDTQPILEGPEEFRRYLATAEPTSVGIFDSYRNVPSSGAPNVSIFLLGPTDEEDFVKVQAVYDIDYVTTTDPAGIYCSVRRYKNGDRTHYYDVFYDEAPGDPFFPTLVAFERRGRLALKEDKSIDRFKVAHGTPFYFLWLPDPSINPMKQEMTETKEFKDDEPLGAYGIMGGKTGFMLTLPMFPSF